jgi:hypothetical protein
MRRRRRATMRCTALVAAMFFALAALPHDILVHRADAAVTKFDGTYEGTLIGEARGGPGHAMSQGACADRIARSISIAGGAVTLVYNPESKIVLKGVVEENGTFAAEADRKSVPSTGYEWTLKMYGSIAGDYLSGQIFAKTCSYRLQMRKSS